MPQGLSKRKIGEYLASPGALNQAVLGAWVARLSLAGLALDEGIRAMIVRVRLPGEAQQIDRYALLCILFFVLSLPPRSGSGEQYSVARGQQLHT